MPLFSCPTCRKQVSVERAEELPYRPFCSKRCKMIDLGRWFNEDYRISEELPPGETAEDESGLQD